MVTAPVPRPAMATLGGAVAASARRHSGQRSVIRLLLASDRPKSADQAVIRAAGPADALPRWRHPDVTLLHFGRSARSIRVFDAAGPLDSLNPLRLVGDFDLPGMLDALDALGSLDPLDPLRPVQALDAVRALHANRLFRTLGAFGTGGSLSPPSAVFRRPLLAAFGGMLAKRAQEIAAVPGGGGGGHRDARHQQGDQQFTHDRLQCLPGSKAVGQRLLWRG